MVASSRPRSRLREDILDAAVRILRESGVKMLAQSRVARAAGIPQGHLTYYFPTKEAILLAVVDRMMAEHRTRMEADRDCPRPPKAVMRARRIIIRGSTLSGQAGTHTPLRVQTAIQPSASAVPGSPRSTASTPGTTSAPLLAGAFEYCAIGHTS